MKRGAELVQTRIKQKLEKDEKIIILKVLVGSHAHGLATKTSDKDYRAVFVIPTSKILSLDYRAKTTDWVEGDEDNTAYEIGHFLKLATKCNPTILEVFKAPVEYMTEEGERLRTLFPYVWNPDDAFNAFVGYGLNQRKKLLDKKDNRQNKYAVAYIRTLACLIELLTTEDFSVEVKDLKFKERLWKYKIGDYQKGDIINHAEDLTTVALNVHSLCKHKPNLKIVNDVLLAIRKRFW